MSSDREPTPADILDDDLLLEEQQSPEIPDDCPLGKLHRKRVAQGRDLTILIADWNLERGSGKTTLALRLAEAMDRTDAGMTPAKATLSAAELTEAYTSQPAQSALVFDEGQAGVSNRRAMAGINEAMRKIVGMGRIEQKYLILTAPGVHQVDKDIRNMCDIWIFVKQVGEAAMFRVGYNPFQDHELTDGWGTLTWPKHLPGQLRHVYDDLTAEKRRRLRGEGDDGEGYVPAEEVAESVESARQEAERQTRDSMIRQVYENTDSLTQSDLAEAVGLSRSRVADILSGGDG